MWTRRVFAALAISAAVFLGTTGVASAGGEAEIAPAVGRSGVVDNRCGCGATVFKRVDLPNGTRLRYRICVDLSFSDMCSPPVEDHA
jgi:hypothetical protein